MFNVRISGSELSPLKKGEAIRIYKIQGQEDASQRRVPPSFYIVAEFGYFVLTLLKKGSLAIFGQGNASSLRCAVAQL